MGVYQVQTDSGTYEVHTEDQAGPMSGPDLQAMAKAEKPTVGDFAAAAVKTPLEAMGLAKQGLTALGVGAEHLINGDSGQVALDRSAEAAKPGFIPQPGEKIGAVAGPTVPLLATGNLPALMALTGGATAGENLNAGKTLKDSAVEGGKDAAITGILGKLVPAAAEAVGNISLKAAEKSVGWGAAAIRRLGAPAVRDMTQTLVDAKVIDPLGRRAVTAASLKAAADSAGAKIGDILDNVGATTNPENVAKDLADKLIPNKSGPLYDKAKAVAQNVVDTARKLGIPTLPGVNVPLRALHDLRVDVAAKAGFNKTTDTEVSELMKKAYGVISDHIKDAVDKIGRPGLKDAYNNLNKVYQAATEAEDAISRRLAASDAAEASSLLTTEGKSAINTIPGMVSRAAGAGPGPALQKGARVFGRGASQVLKRVPASSLVDALTKKEQD